MGYSVHCAGVCHTVKETYLCNIVHCLACIVPYSLVRVAEGIENGWNNDIDIRGDIVLAERDAKRTGIYLVQHLNDLRSYCDCANLT